MNVLDEDGKGRNEQEFGGIELVFVCRRRHHGPSSPVSATQLIPAPRPPENAGSLTRHHAAEGEEVGNPGAGAITKCFMLVLGTHVPPLAAPLYPLRSLVPWPQGRVSDWACFFFGFDVLF